VRQSSPKANVGFRGDPVVGVKAKRGRKRPTGTLGSAALSGILRVFLGVHFSSSYQAK